MNCNRIVTNCILLIILIFGSSKVYAQTGQQKNPETLTLDDNEFERFSSAARSYFLQQKKIKLGNATSRALLNQENGENILVNDPNQNGITQNEPSGDVIERENYKSILLSAFNTSEGRQNKTAGSITGIASSFDSGENFYDYGGLPGYENTSQIFLGDSGIVNNGKNFFISSMSWPRFDISTGNYGVSLTTGFFDQELERIIFSSPKMAIASKDIIDKPYLALDARFDSPKIYISYSSKRTGGFILSAFRVVECA